MFGNIHTHTYYGPCWRCGQTRVSRRRWATGRERDRTQRGRVTRASGAAGYGADTASRNGIHPNVSLGRHARSQGPRNRCAPGTRHWCASRKKWTPGHQSCSRHLRSKRTRPPISDSRSTAANKVINNRIIHFISPF